MSASDNIVKIQHLFRKVLEENITESALETIGFEYHSIPYEAYSAKLAIDELKNLGSLNKWIAFKDLYNYKHASQINVGLGWALAETSFPLNRLNLSLSSGDYWRLGDGFGYYYGLFKRRESIRLQSIPSEVISNDVLEGYLQGLGRSIYYFTSADSLRSKQTINLFSIEKQKHLWRGIGLAFGYVGGSTLEKLDEFILQSDAFQSSFKCGLLLAYEGKSKCGDQCGDLKLYMDYLSLSPIKRENRRLSFSEFITNVESSLN